MEPIWRFQHLDIARCFPTDDATWWKYEPLVPAHARQGVVASDAIAKTPSTPTQINAYATGVLYMCVLNLPFLQCDKDHPQHVRDVLIASTHRPQRYFPCQDHPQFLAAIVRALDVYETTLTLYLTNVLKEQQQYEDMMRTLQQRFQNFVGSNKTPKGRWKARLPREDRPPQRNDDALKGTKQFIDWWYTRGAVLDARAVFRTILIRQLYAAFVQYGPSLTRRGPQYANIALYAAIYTVLEHFGLQPPAPDTLHNAGRRIGAILDAYFQKMPAKRRRNTRQKHSTT